MNLAKSKAQFLFYAHSSSINEDSELNMTCVVDTTKYKTPTITRQGGGDGQPLSIERRRGSNSIDSFVYRKPLSTLADAGVYECSAGNQRGTSTANATVDIEVKG